MRAALTRVLLVFFLSFAFGVVAVSSPAVAASKKKKKKKAHKAAPAKAGAAAAPAQNDDDNDDDDAPSAAASAPKAGKPSQDDDDAKPKPKAKAQASEDKDDDDREASDEKKKNSDDDDDEGGESTVVRHKAKKPAPEGESGALVALEVTAGPRAVHRTFDFNDPLADHQTGAPRPYGYKLAIAPAPFVDLGFYPGAFATRGAGAAVGLIARYEKIVGTQTQNVDGSTFSTLAQQFEVGLRGRLPLAEHEVGLTASYGKQTFHVSATDPGPAPQPAGGPPASTVPNVDYTFAGVDLDGRLRLAPIELGAHVGSRFVMKTGDLASVWFSTTKTTSIEAGLSIAYKVTPLFSIVGGGDIIRYGFNFNPVSPTNYIVAGGAVDQYISGFLALRVSLDGG
jgi:hypothetical protein